MLMIKQLGLRIDKAHVQEQYLLSPCYWYFSTSAGSPALLTLWSLGSYQHHLHATKVRFFGEVLSWEAVLGLVWVSIRFSFS